MLLRKISHYLREPQMPPESLDWSYFENGLDIIGRKKKYSEYQSNVSLFIHFVPKECQIQGRSFDLCCPICLCL